MGLCNAGAIVQNVLNSEFHRHSGPRIAARDQALEVLVLADKLILHGVPHHLSQTGREGQRTVRGRVTVSHMEKRLQRESKNLAVKNMHSEVLLLKKTGDLHYMPLPLWASSSWYL